MHGLLFRCLKHREGERGGDGRSEERERERGGGGTKTGVGGGGGEDTDKQTYREDTNEVSHGDRLIRRCWHFANTYAKWLNSTGRRSIIFVCAEIRYTITQQSYPTAVACGAQIPDVPDDAVL